MTHRSEPFADVAGQRADTSSSQEGLRTGTTGEVGFRTTGQGHDSAVKRTHVLALLIGLLASCGQPSHGPDALSQPVESLRSHAAEGALLARNTASGATTQIFTREHAADLLSLAEQLQASLSSVEVDPSLQPQLDRLRGVADRVTNDLQRLSASDGDPAALAADLQAAADEAGSIGESLS